MTYTVEYISYKDLVTEARSNIRNTVDGIPQTGGLL